MRIGKHSCPSCHHEMDCVEALPGEGHPGPGDGDVGICIKCAYAFFYTMTDGKLGTRSPSASESEDLKSNDEVQRARTSIKIARTYTTN